MDAVHSASACLLDEHGSVVSDWVPFEFGQVQPNQGRLEIPIPALTFHPIRKCFAASVRVEYGTWRLEIPFVGPPVKVRRGEEVHPYDLRLVSDS